MQKLNRSSTLHIRCSVTDGCTRHLLSAACIRIRSTTEPWVPSNGQVGEKSPTMHSIVCDRGGLPQPCRAVLADHVDGNVVRHHMESHSFPASSQRLLVIGSH